MDTKILDETFLGLLESNAFSAIIGFGHFQLLLQREGRRILTNRKGGDKL